MGIVNGISIFNRLLAGEITSEQLETLLAEGLNRASFAQAVSLRRQFRLLLENPAAMLPVFASARAMAIVATSGSAMDALVADDASMAVAAESSVAMSAIAASSKAMTAVAASSKAMTAVAASSTAMTAVAASSTAMAAVAASSTAMAAVNANDRAVRIWMLAGTNQVWSNFASVTAVAASSTAMTAVAASSTAMAAVAASSTAMTAIAASKTAKMAVFNSDTALNAIAASATAMAAMRAAAGYIVGTSTASALPVAIYGPNAAGSYIMLGYSKNDPAYQGIALFSTRRSGSAIATSAGAITNPPSNSGADVNIALPLVAPFQSTATSGIGYTWYFGMLRCDV